MKTYAVFMGMLCLVGSAWASGMQFFEGTWEEALALAKKEDKIIFVDAYAVWCGPCKRMAKEVFPDARVGEFYNRHFINMQIDMERGMGLDFGKQYPVTAFPTLFFIDTEGKIVQKVMGAQSVEAFLNLGKKVIGLNDRSQDYAAAYEQGDRSPELLYKYVQALNRAGKPSLKIANEYLRAQKDLTTDFNLRFLLEAATEADSKIFDWLIQYRKQIAKVSSEDEVNQRILDACRATAAKAIEYQSAELVKEAVDKVKKHYPAKVDAFEAQIWMEFYLTANDVPKYVKTAKSYAKKEIYNDAKELQNLTTILVRSFSYDKNAMDLAEEVAKRAAEVGQTSTYHLIYADVLFRNGKRDAAKNAAQKALTAARSEGQSAVRMVEGFIQKLEEGL